MPDSTKFRFQVQGSLFAENGSPITITNILTNTLNTNTASPQVLEVESKSITKTLQSSVKLDLKKSNLEIMLLQLTLPLSPDQNWKQIKASTNITTTKNGDKYTLDLVGSIDLTPLADKPFTEMYLKIPTTADPNSLTNFDITLKDGETNIAVGNASNKILDSTYYKLSVAPGKEVKLPKTITLQIKSNPEAQSKTFNLPTELVIVISVQ